MKRVIWCLSVGLLTLGLVACGKSADEKAQEHAQDLVTESNNLSTDLTNTTPNGNWSEQDLTVFESKINRLEAVNNELNDADGKHGVIVTGGYGVPYLIAKKRRQLAWAREQRESMMEPSGTVARA